MHSIVSGKKKNLKHEGIESEKIWGHLEKISPSGEQEAKIIANEKKSITVQ